MRPGAGLRFEANGRAVPAGHAVTYDAAVASVAVRFATTARASAGTPACPATATGTVAPAATITVVRLSKRRMGVWVCMPAPVASQPSTSTTTCTAPERLKIDTRPSALTRATTVFATVRPGPGFKADASGRASPVGQTVRKVSAVASTAVTVTTTASTPCAGTPPTPVTWRSSDAPATSGAFGDGVSVAVAASAPANRPAGAGAGAAAEAAGAASSEARWMARGTDTAAVTATRATARAPCRQRAGATPITVSPRARNPSAPRCARPTTS